MRIKYLIDDTIEEMIMYFIIIIFYFAHLIITFSKKSKYVTLIRHLFVTPM